MSGGPDESEAGACFAAEAKAAGLAVPSSRRFDPWLAVGVAVLLSLTALTVGYATDWMNLSRTRPGPLAELPGCAPGGVQLTVGVEADLPGELGGTWTTLTAAFSAATGGCLSVLSTAAAAGFGGLASHKLAAVVGPLVPAPEGPTSLGNETYDVPLFVTPIDVLVNDEGLPSPLNLTANALAGAFLGNVTSWANPLLTDANPGLRSSQNVSVAYLQGPDAANAVFSGYLAQANATFLALVGSGANVSWPVGVPVANVSQMLGWIAATPGGIGYAPGALCPFLPAHVTCAAVQTNGGFAVPSSGKVLAAADVESNTSAASAGDWANVTGVAPASSAVYPMVETTYAVLYRDLGTTYGAEFGLNASKWLIGLFFWIASNTSGTAGELAASAGLYALPGAFATAAEESVLSVTYDGGWILLPPSSLQGESGESGAGEGGETGEF